MSEMYKKIAMQNMVIPAFQLGEIQMVLSQYGWSVNPTPHPKDDRLRLIDPTNINERLYSTAYIEVIANLSSLLLHTEEGISQSVFEQFDPGKTPVWVHFVYDAGGNFTEVKTPVGQINP